MEQFSPQHMLQEALAGQVPTLIGAVLLLLIGWLVALVAAAGTRRLLVGASLNRRLGAVTGIAADLESLTGRLVFWLVLLVALVASFNLLNLLSVSTPFANMLNEIMTFLPRLLAGLVLLLVGWVIAALVRTVLTRLLASTRLDEELSAHAGMPPIAASIGHVAYWLILLMFLPLVLGALNLQGLLLPVENLVNDLLGHLPNLVAASLIGLIGYIVARVVRALVTNLLQATHAQSLFAKAGLDRQASLPELAGTVVFLVVFVPSLIAALDALGITAISEPAIRMLDQIMQAVPNVIAAGLILAITYYVARFAAGMVRQLLAGTGFDSLPGKIGIQSVLGERMLSGVVGQLILFFAMLFATVEAANRLDFGQVRDIVSALILFAGDILLGAVVLLIGFWLANLLGDLVARSDKSGSSWLAGLVRALIMGLVLAMGLRAMGIADSIVNLAFGLTLGAIAVAFALAFGLGGREAAGRVLARWLDDSTKD